MTNGHTQMRVRAANANPPSRKLLLFASYVQKHETESNHNLFKWMHLLSMWALQLCYLPPLRKNCLAI